jgi:hypothetical protein
MTGRTEHGVDRVLVELALLDIVTELLRSVVGRARGAVRPRLAHRLVRVGCGEDPRLRRQRAAGEPARVSRPVEPFVVRGRQLCEGGKARRAGERALGQVGMHAHPLHLGLGQHARLVPDPVGHAEPADVVQQAGASEPGCGGVSQPCMQRGGRRALGDAA